MISELFWLDTLRESAVGPIGLYKQMEVRSIFKVTNLKCKNLPSETEFILD